MTVLVTADWHLNDSPRDVYRHEFISEHLPKLVEQHDVQHLYVLGDITHQRDEHNAVLVNQIVRYLHQLTELCNVTVLRGNHDGQPEAPFFGFINRIRRLFWINNPTGLGQRLFLPHTANFQRDWRDIDFTKYGLILAHNTFHGADPGHGHKLDGIPPEIFKGVPVISGDIHVPQRLNDNVTYVGSPYTIDFGDAFEPRVLLIEDGNTGPGRQKRLIKTTADEVASDDIRFVSTGVMRKSDIVKVEVQITREQVQHWPNIKAAVREWGEKRGYQMHMIVPKREADKRSTNQAQATKRTTKTDAEILTEYGLAKGLDEITMKTGHRLLGRA